MDLVESGFLRHKHHIY